MDYKFYLPNEANQSVEYTTQNNSVIIIGANGSGKSKLRLLDMNCCPHFLVGILRQSQSHTVRLPVILKPGSLAPCTYVQF